MKRISLFVMGVLAGLPILWAGPDEAFKEEVKSYLEGPVAAEISRTSFLRHPTVAKLQLREDHRDWEAVLATVIEGDDRRANRAVALAQARGKADDDRIVEAMTGRLTRRVEVRRGVDPASDKYRSGREALLDEIRLVSELGGSRTLSYILDHLNRADSGWAAAFDGESVDAVIDREALSENAEVRERARTAIRCAGSMTGDPDYRMILGACGRDGTK